MIDRRCLETLLRSLQACHNNAYLLNDTRYPQYPVIKLEDGTFEQENWPLETEVVESMIESGDLICYWHAPEAVRKTSLWNLELPVTEPPFPPHSSHLDMVGE